MPKKRSVVTLSTGSIGLAALIVVLAQSAPTAPPPPCTSTSLPEPDVVAGLRQWAGWQPLAGWQIASAEINTCDGSEPSERLELDLASPEALSPRHLSYRTHLLLWVDAQQGSPEDTPETRRSIAALASALPDLARAAESEPAVSAWLSAHPRTEAAFQPATAARSACLLYVRAASGDSAPAARLEWCEPDGLREVTIEKWDTLSLPWVAELRAEVARRWPDQALAGASLDRFTGPWRARIRLMGSAAGAAQRELTLVRSEEGRWREPGD